MECKSFRVIANISFLFSSILVLFFFLSFSHSSLVLRTREPSEPRGYIDYLSLFDFISRASPVLAYIILVLWLLVLFFLLGSTASHYFCSSLEDLSSELKLSPTIAGVTLLSLGNGAPDVFASTASFAGAATDFGLSSVLGGAFFVSSAVLAIISLFSSASPRHQPVFIDRVTFIRDLFFLLMTLSFLLLILTFEKVRIVEAIAFLSLYIAYVVLVSVSHCCRKEEAGELQVPFLESIEVQQTINLKSESSVSVQSWFFYLIELPLDLPRRLTIPVIAKEKWSKPFAIASAIFSPILLAALWDSNIDFDHRNSRTTVFLFSALLGILLGVAAMECTDESHPPERLKLPWLAGGFIMSIVWTYVVAGELVSLLVSVGRILGVRPSVLGVTVLAWGNSLGDLVANVAMAINGGDRGAQVAVAGCYAGPVFNMLVGLGISFVVASVKAYPSAFVIVRKDFSEFIVIGFMMVGLLWALVVMVMKKMRLNRVLGVGLLVLYGCFVCLRLFQSLELL